MRDYELKPQKSPKQILFQWYGAGLEYFELLSALEKLNIYLDDNPIGDFDTWIETALQNVKFIEQQV